MTQHLSCILHGLILELETPRSVRSMLAKRLQIPAAILDQHKDSITCLIRDAMAANPSAPHDPSPHEDHDTRATVDQ
eukprot:1840165-Prorocentrum_lima.AAC.1